MRHMSRLGIVSENKNKRMELLDKLNWRYATKAMNGKKVAQDKIDRIIEAARLAHQCF